MISEDTQSVRYCSDSLYNGAYPFTSFFFVEERCEPYWYDDSYDPNHLPHPFDQAINDAHHQSLLPTARFDNDGCPSESGHNEPPSPVPDHTLPIRSEGKSDDQDPSFDPAVAASNDTFLLALSGADSDEESQPSASQRKRLRRTYESQEHKDEWHSGPDVAMLYRVEPATTFVDDSGDDFSKPPQSESHHDVPMASGQTRVKPTEDSAVESGPRKPDQPPGSTVHMYGLRPRLLPPSKTTTTASDSYPDKTHVDMQSSPVYESDESSHIDDDSTNQKSTEPPDVLSKRRVTRGEGVLESSQTPAKAQSPAEATGSVNPHSPRLSPTDEEYQVAAGSTRAIASLHTWYQRLMELHQYKIRHGHTNVPQKYTSNPQLGVWVNKQRCTRASLSSYKTEALDKIGFDWGKKKGPQAWNQRFEELRQYKRDHGDCLVPTKCLQYPSLGRWVSTQRSQYKHFIKGKKSSLTRDQIHKLEELEFVWSMT